MHRRRYQVVVVGAGFGGIGMAVALRRAGLEDFVLLDGGDEVGGVWRDNTYPGSSCDVPSHLYSYSFAPYRDTRVRYPNQRAILDYLRGVVRAHDLGSRLRLGTRVTAAEYDEPSAQWLLRTESGEQLRAGVVIFAAGQLHRPHLPAIEGRESFAGTAFHTARWRHEHSLAGADVAIIGTGSSAAQILPAVAGAARTVRVFQRTANWVLPKPRHRFGTVTATALRVPGAHGLYRRAIQVGTDAVLAPVMRRGWPAAPAEEWARRYLRSQIPAPRLRAQLTPAYPIGGKRIVFDSAYLSTLTQPHVELVTDPIAEITAGGVTTADGTQHAVDTIIYATGFRTTEFLEPMTVTGRGGERLDERWRDGGATAFMGLAAPGLPNAFFIAGPNSFTPSGSNPTMKEHQIGYIIECLRWMRHLGAAAIEVDPCVMRRYQRWLNDKLGQSVWPHTASWYHHETGRLTNPWPGTSREFARRLRHSPAASFTAEFRRDEDAAPSGQRPNRVFTQPRASLNPAAIKPR
ncbi:NAD(P)/FAD-dependent oxidoreductase [Nocardia sp. NPDC050712]|uniref:flavin-containing monooxygenase n=1 Tax=Nocardia sp. NPDC050712 TaxID=3155518 RepID=UPI0033C0ED4C